MDEASKLLEDITVSRQQLPTGYRKLSLEPPLVDKVVDPFLTSFDPTLLLKSEVNVVNPSTSLVDPTLPLESEVKVVESTSSPPDPTLSSKSVNTKVVSLTKSSSYYSLPVVNELKPAEFFTLHSDCS